MNYRKNMVEKANEMCEKHGVKLLYLVPFGSRLYGTHTAASDSDYKGVFLPSINSLILKSNPDHISFSTGNDSSKNTSEDYEIELFSIQNFIQKLIGSGQTMGIDMIYAFPHSLYYHGYMKLLFENSLNFYNPGDAKAFIGYAIGQSIRFSVKGERLDIAVKLEKVCNDILEIMVRHGSFDENVRIGDVVSQFEPYFDGNFCMIKEAEGPNKEPQQFLFVLGKQYMFSMKLVEFHKKMKEKVDSYGKRAQAAKDASGLDLKAIYHAERVLLELDEILDTGHLNFPLKDSQYLLNIRNGRVPIEEIRDHMNMMLEKVEGKMKEFPSTKRLKYIEDFILSFYQ